MMGKKEMFSYLNGVADGLKDSQNDINDVLAEAKKEIADIYCGQYCENSLSASDVREHALDIIDKYMTENKD